jgi:filamentous hemagglutinin family protein
MKSVMQSVWSVRGVVSLMTGLATMGVSGPVMPVAFAGSILQSRGGSGATGAGATSGGPATNPATDAAARAGMTVRESGLAKTALALQAMQSMQEAARAAAKAGTAPVRMNPNRPGEALPTVPNGLVAGGLQVAPGVPADLTKPAAGELSNLWVGAKLPKQESAGTVSSAVKVTVEQTAPQALLRWKTFNVGSETELHFDQRAGGASAKQWTAFNQVSDPSGAPSQILGKLTADGQVYVINANGILFSATSQVNLPSLVASSLPINTNLIANGLLNNPDSQFLFSSLSIASGANGTPAFSPDAALVPNGWIGDVKVERGARISTPTSADKVGGRVALIGANVVNEGTISTPEGQTILAAGLQVGFGAHASSDPSLRGLDVFVGEVSSSNGAQPRAGSVRNAGLVEVLRGNVIMAGREVTHSGVVESSTSVALNGRVDFVAGYGAVSNPQSFAAGASAAVTEPFLLRYSGSVELGPGSVIRVLPETASQEAVVGTRLALDSMVNLRGRVIHLGAESALLAPSGRVVLDAGEWKYQGGPLPVAPFLNTAGQIYVDRGAWLDVAGTAGVEIPISRNVVEVELRGTELANSPLQRDGVLRGKTIRVDMRSTGVWEGRAWVGTPLADASGYVGLIQRRAGELTTAGGSVSMRAGGSVVLQPGSAVDVSGGWINYTGGVVETTKVMTAGRVLDISQATPDLVYDGIYSESTTVRFDKYGVVDGFPHPLPKTAAFYEPLRGRFGRRFDDFSTFCCVGWCIEREHDWRTVAAG